MSPIAQRLLEEVNHLSPADRAEVVSRLMDEDEGDDDVDEAWAVEIQRRMDDIRSGRVETLDGEEVFRQLREKYGIPSRASGAL